MRFLDWLEAECQALDQLDAMERGEIPVGPIVFTKRDGSTFREFVQVSKANADGTRTTTICNAGGLAMAEAGAAEAALAAAAEVQHQVTELEKRLDRLATERADCIEVSAADLAAVLAEALDEAGAE